MSKLATLLLLVILTVSSLLMTTFGSASAVTKPSVPDFTLKYIVDSYDVPPTYKIDPYTGENVVDSEGYHVENKTLQVIVKNQLFTPRIDASGNSTSLYYEFRFKGHFEDEWKYYPVTPSDYGSVEHPTDPYQTGARGSSYVSASSLDETVVILPNWQLGNIPEKGQIDVQVQALLGHDNKKDWVYGMFGGNFITYYFEGEASDWSDTQTVTVLKSQTPISSPETTPTPDPTSDSTPTPSQEPQQTVQIEPIVATAVVALILGAALGLLIGRVTKK